MPMRVRPANRSVRASASALTLAHDRPDRAPHDAHQLADRGLGRVHRQPRHLIIEGIRVARVVAGPRHTRHGGTVLRTVHPRRVGLQHNPHRACVQQ